MLTIIGKRDWGKNEMKDKAEHLEDGKKRKPKKRYWILAGLSAVVILLLLPVCCRPRRYSPVEVGQDDRSVSPYLTHELLPELHNKSQLDEPFEMIVTEEGINDIIARSQWPVEAGGITFSRLQVDFAAGVVWLMATATAGGVDFVLSAELNPVVNAEGLLNLHVETVKVGAVNITPLARLIARRVYAERLGPREAESEGGAPAGENGEPEPSLTVKITRSVVNDEPFEPVFEMAERKLRLMSVDVEDGRMSVILQPVGE